MPYKQLCNDKNSWTFWDFDRNNFKQNEHILYLKSELLAEFWNISCFSEHTEYGFMKFFHWSLTGI